MRSVLVGEESVGWDCVVMGIKSEGRLGWCGGVLWALAVVVVR